MDVKNLAELYELDPLDWAPIEDRLNAGLTQAPGTGGPNRHTCWLATLNPDGSPHVTGVGALWVDGAFWFETGEHTRKGRNLARDPRATLSMATDEFDLVVEGTVERVTDPPTVAAMAARWAGAGWPVEVDESGIALTAEFERAVRRSAPVARLPVPAPSGNRPADRAARWRHPVVVLRRRPPLNPAERGERGPPVSLGSRMGHSDYTGAATSVW